MAFEVRTNTQQESSGYAKVDWDALNKYVVETAQLQEQEVVVGVISGLYDVGVQKQEDAKYEWTGTPEDEAKETAAKPDTYFEDLYDYESKSTKRYKRHPVKDQQSVVLAIDFPEIMLDKSSFFGQENADAKPLRLILGGEFIPYKGADKICAKPIALTMRKNDKTNNQWSMMPNSTLYKMAVGAKVIKAGEPFLPQDIDKLLGKALQFKVQVGFNDKGYMFEKCAFAAGLGRSQVAPEYDPSIIHIVQFNADNTEADLKQLRLSVRNTMKKATDYPDSKLKGQLEALFPNMVESASDDDGEDKQPEAKPTPAPKAKVAQKPAKAAEPPIDFDDDSSPF